MRFVALNNTYLYYSWYLDIQVRQTSLKLFVTLTYLCNISAILRLNKTVADEKVSYFFLISFQNLD